MELAKRIKRLAREQGFDLAGIARLEPTPESAFFREWVARGYAGEMAYLGRRTDERADPRLVLEGGRSALVVGLVYDRAEDPDAVGPGDGARGRVARYAGGDDYHDVLLERLEAVGERLGPLAGRAVRWRSYVDTGPVLERVLAAYAGLGWIGKNTCLIDPRLGSYLFLGVLLTDLDLPPDDRTPDHCGSCRACLDVCPTQAFPEPYVLDATRCLSYTTIELRGPIPQPLRPPQDDWLFGCDACQEVCPWNQRRLREIPEDTQGLRGRLAPRSPWLRPALAWVLALDTETWRRESRRTALRRAKHRGLLRNALVAAGNSGDRSLVPLLERHAAGGDPLLAEHARWALEKLGVR